MITVNIYEAKTQLSRLLRRVRAGEEFVIADAGTPIARVIPILPHTGQRLGGDEGQIWISEDFDAPLPRDTVAGFWGGGPRAPRHPRRQRRRRSGRKR